MLSEVPLSLDAWWKSFPKQEEETLSLTSSVTKDKAEEVGEVFMGDKRLQKRDLESVSLETNGLKKHFQCFRIDAPSHRIHTFRTC